MLPVVTFQINYLYLGVGFCETPAYITFPECFSHFSLGGKPRLTNEAISCISDAQPKLSLGNANVDGLYETNKTNSCLSSSVVVFPVVLA